jgi:hypothetical protein
MLGLNLSLAVPSVGDEVSALDCAEIDASRAGGPSAMRGGGSRKSSAINGSLSSAVRVSKRRLLPESGLRERRRCHNVVTLMMFERLD